MTTRKNKNGSDRERAEKETFSRLKSELGQAFAAPESTYEPTTAAQVIARNRTD